MNFGSEGTFQPSKGKAMAQSYRVEFLRLHRTESMTPKSFFSSVIENPWAKSKRHMFKPGLHIFSETSKLQQALVNFPWSNHPKERINTDKHPLSVSREHLCKYITCSYAVKDDQRWLDDADVRLTTQYVRGLPYFKKKLPSSSRVYQLSIART